MACSVAFEGTFTVPAGSVAEGMKSAMTKFLVSELVFASWATTTGARSVGTFCMAVASRLPLTVTRADSPGAKVTVALGIVGSVIAGSAKLVVEKP